MSITCSVLGVTSVQMRALRAKPALVSKLALVAHIDLLKAHIDELTERMTPEQRAQLEASQAPSAASPAATETDARIADARAALGALGPIESALSLEKSWHMLHYLFTGHVGTWRPGELLPSGTIPGEDAAYGPARLYDDVHAPRDLLLSGQVLGEDVGYGPARLHDEAANSSSVGSSKHWI
jgi:Domain of unknown function (DUF1877)